MAASQIPQDLEKAHPCFLMHAASILATTYEIYRWNKHVVFKIKNGLVKENLLNGQLSKKFLIRMT